MVTSLFFNMYRRTDLLSNRCDADLIIFSLGNKILFRLQVIGHNRLQIMLSKVPFRS